MVFRVVFGVLLCVAAKAAPPSLYVTIADQYDIPPQYLFALAKTESNARLTIGYYPWPWTLNVAGKPLRFNTRRDACEALERALTNTNAKRIDIGITQLNWGWNGIYHFSHPCDALDPRQNLTVAATLFRGHYEKYGDWVEAAGRYHRPAGGAPARRYKASFQAHLP